LAETSGSKLWRLKYRFANKEKKFALGVYPEVTLAQVASANTFEAVAREWFSKFSSGWAESHRSKVLLRRYNDLFPWLGHRPIAEIEADELLQSIRRVEARGALDTGVGCFVFPSEISRRRPMSENTINAALRRLGYGGVEMTGHGFRAMARTILDEVLDRCPARLPDAGEFTCV
jgi:Phage integrase central domain/Arm DNA-binding domain